MATCESIPFLIDQILGELEEAATIRIECNAADGGSRRVSGNIKITSVNGATCAWHFLHYMEHLRGVVMERLREAIPRVGPGDMDIMLDQLLRRVRRIGRSAEVIRLQEGCKATGLKAQWLKRFVRCRYQGRDTENPEIWEEAISLTHRYALIYLCEMRKLEDRITLCAATGFSIPAAAPANSGIRPAAKFRLSCSVAFFCAMLRTVCDRNIVENPNISELCRMIAAACCTTKQETLSARSLRNCFNNPTPKVLEEVLNEVHAWDRYLTKFISRLQK